MRKSCGDFLETLDFHPGSCLCWPNAGEDAEPEKDSTGAALALKCLMDV